MKKVLLVEDIGYNNDGLLIDPNEVEEKVYLGDYSIIIEGINVHDVDVDELTKKLNASKGLTEFFNNEDIENFLINIGFKNARVGYAKHYYANIEDKLVFDKESNIFYNLADSNRVLVYQWNNGSELQTIELTDEVTETTLVISDKYVDLDEWDGRNYTTGDLGNHQCIYKVLELNGEKVKSTFLINCWSQWVGSHQYGEIEDLDGLITHLQEINREVGTYLEMLKGL